MAKVQTPGASVNDAHKSYRQGSTEFPMSYLHFTTEQYALLNPFFFMEGVEGDSIPLNSVDEIRSHTMIAPLMSKIKRHKDYYAIPMRAILPKTWEQIYANPTQGSDIPEDANCTFPIDTIMKWIQANFIGNTTAIDEVDIIDGGVYLLVIKMVLTAEMFLSNGSLLSKAGYRLSPLYKYYPLTEDDTIDTHNAKDFDQWFDTVFIPWLLKLNPSVDINGTRYAIDQPVSPWLERDVVLVSTHRFLELCRDYMDFSDLNFHSLVDPGNTTNGPRLSDLFGNPIQHSFTIPTSQMDWTTMIETPAFFNIARVLAYQLVSFHYYTNDKVDSIYSAALYRGLMQSLAGLVVNPDSSASAGINTIRKYYIYNGELLEYDLFSEAVMKSILEQGGMSTIPVYDTDVPTLENPYTKIDRLMGWLRNIFGFNRSLRYGDYFTGARPQPLAVGDINTTIIGSSVNTIDLTKSLLMQRFLNAVNRVGRKFSDYVNMLSGELPPRDPHDPIFLAHTSGDLGTFEVENTAEDQGNIVTLMRDGSSRYAFSFDVSEPCLVLGLSWYEVSRIYSKTIDRFAFHRTRFDMFNKFFQYQGDQSVFAKELDARYLADPARNFAYTLRYMEYKQRPSIATGGFVNYLPGYAFITDNDESGQLNTKLLTISPEYIRANPSELDRFFGSLTNYSLAGYFHFIVKYLNETNPSRQMEYAPSVL